MPSRPHKEQPGKVSCEIGTVRKSKTKKRRKRRIWKCLGLRQGAKKREAQKENKSVDGLPENMIKTNPAALGKEILEK